MPKKTYIITIIFTLFCTLAVAQSKEAARYEIDVKRVGLDYEDREALIRSREFIRLDPTYYVGYLYEGVYKYEKSTDYLGFENCIPSLKKSIKLLEDEFGSKLSAHYNSWAEYVPLRIVQTDYAKLNFCLLDAYSNLEQPDSVMITIKNYQRWNMQRDDLGANNYIAWTIHRNRFYTKSKYDFLENSIKENDKKAFSYLYRSLAETNANAELNERTFPSIYIEGDRLSAYHYLALIHDYEQNVDSAMYYYQKMEYYNIFPYNNFATFLFVNGDFASSEQYFNISRARENTDKRLRESEYHYVTFAVLKGRPVDGVKRMNDLMRELGVSSGWGWYNIAMARAYLYNGQIDKAEEHLRKAKNFREVHIGTTWGQSHYDTSIKFLQLKAAEMKIAAQKFENRKYLLSPGTLAMIGKWNLELYAEQFVLMTQLASNPEREDVFFKIFSPECTVTFDELFSALRGGLSSKYFAKLYEKYLTQDKRQYIHKYFKLFLANIYNSLGDDENVRKNIDKIFGIEYIDDDYEVLFKARVYELLAKISSKASDRTDYLLKFYTSYPQLVPFSGLRMPFRLDVRTNGENTQENEILDKLQKYNIRIATNSESQMPIAKISFSNDGKNDILEFEVSTQAGTTIVPHNKIVCDNADNAARKLAYGLFNSINPPLNTNSIRVPGRQ